MSPPKYWLSASVLTTTSAPSLSDASRPGLEAGGEALVVREPDDVVDAVLARDLDRAVGRAVVDDQPLDRLEPRHLARKIAQRDREGVLLVQARDLDDQLHGGRGRYRQGLMESAALTRREPGSGIAARARRVEVDTLAKVAFAVLCVGFLVGFLVFPTYPNYDSYYSLLWGREVLDLQAPFFEGFRVPTEHPLAIAAGALLSLLGEGGDRVWVAMTLASFLWLVWGIYRLGQVAFTPLVGAIAALLLLTRFDFAFLAARGYVDVPYMALVVWAAVMEAVRPRRGWPVFALLAAGGAAAAGGLDADRPLLPVDEPRRDLGRARALRGAGGDRAARRGRRSTSPSPATRCSRCTTRAPRPRTSGRQRTLGEIPSALPSFFASIVKLPVLLGALGRARVRGARRAAAGGDAARAAAERHRDVRADRDRRPVGDRALPDRRRAGAARVRRRRARRLHDAAAGAAADGVGDGRAAAGRWPASPSPPRASTSRASPTSCSSAATPTPRSCTCSTTRR